MCADYNLFAIMHKGLQSPYCTKYTMMFLIHADDWDTGKTGIAFLCVCEGDPGSKDHIANCSAMKMMQECLRTKLGFHTIPVGTNVTQHQLDTILDQIEHRTLPESYRRVVFYFFGHGNAQFLILADGKVERQHIINKFQSISPKNSDVFKIIMFDCCRMEKSLTCVAVEETNQKTDQDTDQKALAARDSCNAEWQYLVSRNTLVIDATDVNSEALYLVKNGCGLFTQRFAELATTRNISLGDLLAEIRREVHNEVASQHNEQLVVVQDKLLGTVNLLEESQGTGKLIVVCQKS